jgi:hypothetical protein
MELSLFPIVTLLDARDSIRPFAACWRGTSVTTLGLERGFIMRESFLEAEAPPLHGE